MRPRIFARAVAGPVGFCLLFSASCTQEMSREPRYNPLQKSAFFEDGRSARPLVDGTVARGHLDADDLLYRGRVNSSFADEFPFPVTRAVLERGRERHDIFCSPCHGRVGDGRGMIAMRGFRPFSSYHTDRLRRSPAGYLFEVITHGKGAQSGFASEIPPEDRWAIVAYIRALQLSQRASVAELPPEDRRRLEASAHD